MTLFLAAPSFGQWRVESRYGQGYDSRGAYVERLIRQAENRSDLFARVVDMRSNRGFFSRVFNVDRSSELTARAHDLERELNAVRYEFDREGNSYELRSRIANVLNVAQSIDNTMRYRRMDSDVERQWTLLRSDLNRLARIYNLQQIG